MSATGPERILAIETIERQEFIGQIALHQIHWLDRRANLAIHDDADKILRTRRVSTIDPELRFASQREFHYVNNFFD
jgi:hypothetical protein